MKRESCNNFPKSNSCILEIPIRNWNYRGIAPTGREYKDIRNTYKELKQGAFAVVIGEDGPY